jgi:hypothetical protein
MSYSNPLPVDKVTGYSQWETASAPPVSPAGTARIYFNGTKLQVSENGGAYTDLVSGGGGGGAFSIKTVNYPGAAAQIPAVDFTPGTILLAKLAQGPSGASLPPRASLPDGATIIVRDDSNPPAFGNMVNSDGTQFYGAPAQPGSGTSVPGPYNAYEFRVANMAVMFTLNKSLPGWEASLTLNPANVYGGS